MKDPERVKRANVRRRLRAAKLFSNLGALWNHAERKAGQDVENSRIAARAGPSRYGIILRMNGFRSEQLTRASDNASRAEPILSAVL